MDTAASGPTQSMHTQVESSGVRNQDIWSTGPVWALGLIGQALVALFVLTVAQSFFWAGHVPLVLKLGVGAVGCLAYTRPNDALLIVAGLAPIMRMFGTRILTDAYPARTTEAIVLAFLAGWLLGRLQLIRTTSTAPSTVRLPALLFGTTVAASCAVQLIALQISKDNPWSFINFFAEYLATAYLTAPIVDLRPWVGTLSGYEFIVSAATILEGLGLFLAVITLCRGDSTLARRLGRMVVVGAVGVSALSIVELFTSAIGTGNPSITLPELLQQRWAVFVSKVNTAGSYFVLVLPIALGLAADSKHRPVWLGTSVVIGIALWLSGSRAVLLTSLVLLLTGVGLLGIIRPQILALRGLRRGAVAVGIASVALVLGYRLIAFADSSALESLHIRWLFVETTFRMLTSSPWLGIGVGQYRAAAELLNSQELQKLLVDAFSSRLENPHNYFLLIVAEFGIIGFGLFSWLLISGLRRIWHGVQASGAKSIASGAGIGLVACCVTLVANHSLVYAEVAYSFWLVFGLVVALGESIAVPDNVSAGWVRHSTLTRWLVPITLIVVVGSVPIRAGHERSKINLSRISYGFYDWELEGNERPLRWTGQHATFFVQSNVRQVRIPLRAVRVRPEWVFAVDVRLDNRLAQRLTLEGGAWHDVTLDIPPSDQLNATVGMVTTIMESAIRPGESWLGPISGHTAAKETGTAKKLVEGIHYPRVDLVVSPSWRPSAELPGSTDMRELGVQVGEITLLEIS